MTSSSIATMHVVYKTKFTTSRGQFSSQAEPRPLACDIRRMLDDSIKECHADNANFIYWLQQYDGQRLYLDDAYSSTYDFLVRGHGFSEGSAWRRIRVARLAGRVPAILENIACGSINFTVLALIAEAALDSQNLNQALAQCQRKSKKEAEKTEAPGMNFA
jgi:hypothetical protein